MKLPRWYLILPLLSCPISSLIASPAAAAQEPNLERIAKKLSKQLTKTKIDSVVVADFLTKAGDVSAQGHYLADQLSLELDQRKKHFIVVDRMRLSDALRDGNLSPRDLAVRNSLERIGGALSVGAVVMGTVEPSASTYDLSVSVVRVRDGNLVASEELSVVKSSFLEGLASGTSSPFTARIPRAGTDGIGIPSCVYCPDPEYTDQARKEKLKGVVTLDVKVTAEGRVTNIVVVKASHNRLAEKAVEAVRTWKLQPAKDKEGRPVSVRVQIEVTFHLY